MGECLDPIALSAVDYYKGLAGGLLLPLTIVLIAWLRGWRLVRDEE